MAMSLIISLMCLFMTVDVDSQREWVVNYNPSYVCALRESTVRMSCTYSDNWVQSVYWSKTTLGHVSVSPNLCSDRNNRAKVQCYLTNKGIYGVTLTRVTESDEGIYYCMLTSTYNNVYRGTPGVDLIVTDLQVETPQRVKEGDSVTLTCKTTCRLTEETTFIWYRNTQRLTEGRFTVNEFHLQSVSRQDSGVYRCAAQHLSSPGVYLNVEYVDSQQVWGVNYNPSYVCALRESTVRMSCTLKYPSYHVVKKAFWTKTVGTHQPSDLCLNPEDRRVKCHRENKDTHILTLTHVTEADKHIYYCRFTTNQPDGKYTGVPGLQLDVTDVQVETDQRVKEGDSVTLTCKTTCRLTEETTFIWYRNTQRLTEGRFTVNEFHLQSVSRQDSGVYRCAAQHLSSPGVYLSVEHPPRNVSASISSSGVIVEGDTLNLTCSSQSNPPANISWFKGETFVRSGKIYIIYKITSDHSGEYKCKSINQHGEKYSDTVTLNVLYPPRNVSVSISTSSDSMNLTCSSESNPPVHIYSWFKENQTSSVGSGQRFRALESGWFYCLAQNEVGSQRSDSVSFTVKDVQGSAVVSGIVAGCGGLFFVIIFIILFLWMKKKDGGAEVNMQNQAGQQIHASLTDGQESASPNKDPMYSLVSFNQKEVLKSADADYQYASVLYIKTKEMDEKEEEYMNFKVTPTSDPDSSVEVIYSSVKP